MYILPQPLLPTEYRQPSIMTPGRRTEPSSPQHKAEGIELHLCYQGTEAGPLFWAQYPFLGLDPVGLKDEYCPSYFHEMRNLTLVNRAFCIRNPKHYKGFGPDCWGLTASYSVDGYAAHSPNEQDDKGVISPTAALSSIVYTPEYSMQVMRHLYNMGDKVFGPFSDSTMLSAKQTTGIRNVTLPSTRDQLQS